MPSLPIRIRDEDKARLERLQAELAATTGKKPSQQEVVGLAVQFALRHKQTLLREVGWTPPAPAAARRWLDQAEDLGDWTTADIDDLLYGDRA